MVDGCDLDGPGQAGEPAAEEERQQSVLPGGHAQEEGRPPVLAHRLEVAARNRSVRE